ncbi:MAG: copper resistance protein CopC/CopD, partial [Longispora sp.]|nr:copper resistance protein CopC/CopD [Longispora sp. (in: high G+C Gram-positive bacteria)]
DNKRADQGEVQSTGDSVTIPLRAGGGRGTYLVSYRVISADSHPISGGYSFSIGVPSATSATVGLGGSAEVDPVVSVLIQVARYLGFIGIALVVGAVLFASTLWPSRLPLPGKLVWTGVALIAVSTVAGLYLQAPYATGSSLTNVSGDDLRAVLHEGRFGFAGQVRLAIVIASIPFLHRVLSRKALRSDWILLAILGVGAAFTWPFAGHPGATSVPVMTVAADMVHLLAMSVWIGGLVVLFAYLLPKGTESELRALLPVWSRWAIWSVAVLAITGLAQSLIQVGALSELVDTRYGQLLLLKVGIFLLVLALAAGARRMVRSGGVSLRGTVVTEMAGLALMLAVTTVLVQTIPARTASTASVSTGAPYAATATSKHYRLLINIDPGKLGNNSMHLYASTPDGKPIKVLKWKATIALPSNNIESIDVPLLPLSDDHTSGELTFPTAGAWRLSCTLLVSEVDQSTVTQIVNIS